MEASLMQVYAPRDPVAEYISGKITLRKLRVMIEGIPLTPETPIGRAVLGPWGDQERLLHIVANETRALRTSFGNVNRKPETQAIEFDPIPAPKPTYYQRKASKKNRQDKKQRAIEQNLLEVIARNQEGANHGG